jgi:Metal binding domain of Ada
VFFLDEATAQAAGYRPCPVCAPDIRFEYSLHAPCRGRDEVRAFAEKFRAAFPISHSAGALT